MWDVYFLFVWIQWTNTDGHPNYIVNSQQAGEGQIEHRGLEVSMPIMHDTVVVGMCHHMSNSIKCTTSEANSNANYKL